MSLRVKLALVLACLAGLSAVGVGWFSYQSISSRMLSEIDATLRAVNGGEFEFVGALPTADDEPGRPVPPGGGVRNFRRGGFAQNVVQFLDRSGDPIVRDGAVTLVVTERDRTIARLGRGENLETTTGSDGRRFRVLTRSFSRFGTAQIGRDLSEMDRVLGNLRARILRVGALAAVIAAITGWLFANRLTKSLRRLTAAAEEVSTTGRLDIDLSGAGSDEVGRLSAAFSKMLGALNTSRAQQERLVQDAGHELRTPLTSLRTNVDVLRRHSDLSADMHAKLLDDLDVEVGELSALVEEVVAVGSGRSSDEAPEAVVLADVVRAATDRVVRRTGRQITVDADDTVVIAQRSLLERAVTNLADNAAKFDNTDLPISVTSHVGRVSVRDHGPGIDDGDLPHVFDRFFRAASARSERGSGLGLSIVDEIAAAHNGSTFAENHPSGGAVVGFQLPVVAPER